MVEEGLLSLDQPLIEVLPPSQRIASLGSDHTLHHILSHTSALPNYFDDDDPTWTSWMSSFDRVPVYHIRRPADISPSSINAREWALWVATTGIAIATSW